MSERAKAVRLRTFEEARYLGHDRIGTEHLLLGILAQDNGEAAALLRRNNVKFSEVRSAADLLNGSAPADPK
ncbi:MAG: Clp protease N-terminal domain-containing protein, partial [Rubrobacteraceae bacterium]